MGIACDKPWFFKYDFLERSHLKLNCFIFNFDFLKVNFKSLKSQFDCELFGSFIIAGGS